MRVTKLASIGFGLGLAVTGVVATAGHAQGSLAQQSRVTLAPGVEHITLLESNPSNVIHVARISAHAPVAIKALLAPTTGSGANLTKLTSLCSAANAVVCVNGDFYGPTGSSLGGELSDGHWVRQPTAAQQQVWLDRNNRFSIGAMPVGALQSLGATKYPIVQDGRVGPIPEHDAFSDLRHARTLVGWNAAGDSYFVTVDQGRGSQGMTMTEAGNLMTQLGATNAVNEDGGGSSQFVVGQALANTPQYGPRGVTNAWAVVAQPGRSGSSAPTGPFAPFVANRAPARR